MYFMAGGKSVGERFKGRLELSGPPRCPTATLRSLQEGAGFALGAAGFRADGPGEAIAMCRATSVALACWPSPGGMTRGRAKGDGYLV